MRIVWPGWCSLEIPEGWTHDDGPDLVSICRDEDGVGALQMSFARRAQPESPTPEAVKAVARSYAAQQGWGLGDDTIRVTTVDGAWCAEFEHVEANDGDSTYWQVWHVLDSTRLVFITYVCESAAEGLERSGRGMIVASLRWSAVP